MKMVMTHGGEIYFSRKGIKITAVPHAGSYNLDYLSAPLLLGFRLCKNLSVLYGAEFSYLLRAKAKNFSPDTEYYERFDMGLDGGLSYKVGTRWSVDLRYIFGLLPLDPPAAIGLVNNVPTEYSLHGYERERNRDLQLGIACRLSGK